MASPVKRTRATRAEMAERRAGLVAIADVHGPCSVRHVYYLASGLGVPGITKTDSGYNKVQREVVKLRRAQDIPYRLIVDGTRWMRKPRTWGSPEEMLLDAAATYRRALWRENEYRVEVWCESESIAGTVYEVTEKWDVPLMPTRGYSSESFAYGAAADWLEDDRKPVVIYIGDHDAHGFEIERSLRFRLEEFYGAAVEWTRLAVTWDQVVAHKLAGTPPKTDRPYPYPFAVDAEALPPLLLRSLLDAEIEQYVDARELRILQKAEESERELLWKIVKRDFT